MIDNNPINDEIAKSVLPMLMVNSIGTMVELKSPIIPYEEYPDSAVRTRKIRDNVYLPPSCGLDNLTENGKEYLISKLSHSLTYGIDEDMIETIKSEVEINPVVKNKLAKNIKKTARAMVKKFNGHNSNVVILLSPLAYAAAADEIKKEFPKIKLMWAQTEVDNNTATVVWVDTNRFNSAIRYYHNAIAVIQCAKELVDNNSETEITAMYRGRFVVKDKSKIKVFVIDETPTPNKILSKIRGLFKK